MMDFNNQAENEAEWGEIADAIANFKLEEVENAVEPEETIEAIVKVELEKASKSLSSSSSSPASEPVFQTFTLFPDFPAELRYKIWYHAATSGRIVKWGRQVTPAIFRTSHESRREAILSTTLVMCPLRAEEQYGFYINFENDQLYRKTRMPGPARVSMQYFNNLRMAHFNLLWGAPQATTVVAPQVATFGAPQIAIFHASWTRRVKYLILPLDDVASLVRKDVTARSFRGHSWIEPSLWSNILYMFPDLKQLRVVLDLKLEASTLIEDLKCWSPGSVTIVQGGMMSQIQKSYLRFKDRYDMFEDKFETKRPYIFELEFVGVGQ